MTGNEIARKVNMSAAGIRPRLDKLHNQGIIKPLSHTGIRTFKREFGNVRKTINAPRSIFWGLDVKEKKK